MHLIDSVMSMPHAFRKMTEFDEGPDRAWLVAGLTHAGWTANEIAHRTNCSVRLVKDIRSWDMTQMARFALEQITVADARYHAERSAHSQTRRELVLSRQEIQRVREQMDRLVKKVCAGEPIAKCYRGHPIIEGSTYRSRNRDYCRECNRENTVAYRARKRKPSDLQCHAICVSPPMHTPSVASAS